MKIFTSPREGMNSLILRLVLIAAFAGMAMMAQAQATVQTDQLDYPPGSTAIITGIGFQSGENVELHVHHADGDPLGTDPDNHLPWSITADEYGNFTTTWYVPTVEEGDAAGATLNLEAHGDMGSEASWIFTDALKNDPSNFTACNGSSASFSITTTGTGFTLVWQVSTNGGSTWSDLSNGGIYSGVTIKDLAISSVTTSMSGYQYRCKHTATSGGAVTYSGSATLTVRPAPTATISGTTTVCQNVTAPDITFTNPQALPVTITYRINSGSNATITVAASSNATLAAPTGTAGTFAYNLLSVAYQTIPNCPNPISGQTATVTVSSAPTITGPSNSSVPYGSSATFSVSATGTYQWQLSTNGGTSWTDISGQTASSLSFTRPTVSMSGNRYRCVVTGTGSCSATSSSATLTVTAISLTGNFTAANKIYDANTSAAVLTRSLNSGVVSPDVVNLTGGTATFNNKDAGTGKTVTLAGASLSGADAGNYSLGSVATTTANITPLPMISSKQQHLCLHHIFYLLL